MLYQVRDRAQTAIVLDVDSEFVQEFYRRGARRCGSKSPRRPMPVLVALARIPRGILHDGRRGNGGVILVRGAARTPTEEFFRDSARTLIEAIFEKATGPPASRQHRRFSRPTPP